MRPFTRALIGALALIALAPGQGDNEPYFALSTSRTFSTTAKPAVSLTAWNVESVEFRAYRIKDPVAFFTQLENAHQFGTTTPRPPRERTVLERIRRWKRTLRSGIRSALRSQFTESPRRKFNALLPDRTAPKSSKGSQYAQAPILNQQQLELTFTQPVRSRSRWESQVVEVPVRGPGVYVVEAVNGDLRAFTVMVVSDLAMVIKTGGGRMLAFLMDRNTGQPAGGVPVYISSARKQVSEAKTDAQGVVEMTPPSSAAEVDIRVLALRGADFAAGTLPSGPWGPNAEHWMGYVYTDRPVYRPGHPVHFKGVLRIKTSEGFQNPAGRPVAIRIQDPEGKPVFERSVTTSANGTVSGDLQLPASAALGFYLIELKAGDATANGNFWVEEYKKPEYEVRVIPSQPRVLQGAEAELTIDARYYFGEPVSGATVEYAVFRDRYWNPFWGDAEDDDTLPDPGGDGDDAGGDQTSQKQAVLNAAGKAVIRIPTEVSNRKFDYRYRIEARVTDAARREITGKGTFLATYGTFFLRTEPAGYVYAPGQTVAVRVHARDYDNQPVDTQVRVELFRWNPRDPDRADVLASATAPSGGTASLRLPDSGGSYRIRSTARTPENRDVEDDAFVWVSGGDAAAWSREGEQTLRLVTDKRTYAAGETARVLIAGTKPGVPVYVTVEGSGLGRYQVLRPDSGSVVFELPVTANAEPGITLGAVTVHGGQVYTGTKFVSVPPVEHRMAVSLSTDKPQYLPGETAAYSLSATDNKGRPVANAEFSLGVVDEAIYAVRREALPDMAAFFLARGWNRVYTANSFEYWFHGEAGKRRMRLAQLSERSPLAQLKPERTVQPKVRKAFPDTAYWIADLVTDGAGTARARVPFPDSLTTWRATARGITRDTEVGSAVLKTIVRKNVILRLAAPRFLIQGDESVISAIVHNYLPSPVSAQVTLQGEGWDLVGGAARQVEIASRAEVRIDWRVRARLGVSSAKLAGQALASAESDALEIDIPVHPRGVRMTQSRSGVLNNTSDAQFDLAFPANAEPGSRSVAIQIAPSLAASVFRALEFLTAFPYGCVEQTMSSFVPNLVVRQALNRKVPNLGVDEALLQEKIRTGVERLASFQHEDGGWGWWDSDNSHPFMTAYVVAGLAQARAAGVRVDDSLPQRGADLLRSRFWNQTAAEPDLRAYIAYALAAAGDRDPKYASALFDARSRLSPYGLALLGLALDTLGDARSVVLASDLERSVQQSGEEAWWRAARDPMLDLNEDVSAEATAYAVKLLARKNASNPLLPKAALWLVRHRNEGYWWTSTKQTAMVIDGLSGYMAAGNELEPSLNATVRVNGRTVATRAIRNALEDIPEIVIPEPALRADTNSIRVESAGSGRLYYSLRAGHHVSGKQEERRGTVALNVLREYFRLTESRDGDRVVYDAAPLEGTVAPGDLLAVRLTVSGSEWKYLMVEDPIPAGAEPVVNEESYRLRRPLTEAGYTRRELRDDRVALFETVFPKGQRQYSYLLKVIQPGLFSANPAQARPMYQSGVLATSGGRSVEVK